MAKQKKRSEEMPTDDMRTMAKSRMENLPPETARGRLDPAGTKPKERPAASGTQRHSQRKR
jgi:hypothetical protein